MYNGSCVVEVVKEAVHAAMSEKRSGLKRATMVRTEEVGCDKA